MIDIKNFAKLVHMSSSLVSTTFYLDTYTYKNLTVDPSAALLVSNIINKEINLLRSLEDIKQLPDITFDFKNRTGIYFLFKDGELIYIGKSVNVFSRISDHYNHKNFDSFKVLPCKEEELEGLESKYTIKFLSKTKAAGSVDKTWIKEILKDNTKVTRCVLKLKKNTDEFSDTEKETFRNLLQGGNSGNKPLPTAK